MSVTPRLLNVTTLLLSVTNKALTDELLRLAKIQRFGASSEKHPHQINLFDEAELEVAIDDLREQVPEETHTRTHHNKQKEDPQSWFLGDAKP